MSKENKIIKLTLSQLLPMSDLVSQLANGKVQYLLKLAKKGILKIGTAEDYEKEVGEEEDSPAERINKQLNKLRKSYEPHGYDPDKHGYLKVFEWEDQKYIVGGGEKWHVLKDLYGEDYKLYVKEVYE